MMLLIKILLCIAVGCISAVCFVGMVIGMIELYEMFRDWRDRGKHP